MALTAHAFQQFAGDCATKLLSLNGVDTLKVALYNGSTPTYTALSSVQTKAQYESTLTVSEITGTGYTAGGVTLASVAIATVGAVCTLSAANAVWTSATFTAQQALFYDSSVSSDVIAYWDFGAATPVSSGTFTLNLASGIVTFTAS